MALGTSRTRNWGKDEQASALALVTHRHGVAWQIRSGRLFLAACKNGIQLPFNESFANLKNVKRGRWEAQHPWDGRLLATGCSQRDVVRATIETVCH